MQALLTVGVRKRLGIAGWIAACSLFAISSPAQRPVARITTVVDDADRTTIYGTHPVMARTEDEAGRVPLGSKFEGISIAFSRTPAQEADLQALLAAQQDPTSPLYAKWLTPDEFGARLGWRIPTSPRCSLGWGSTALLWRVFRAARTASAFLERSNRS